MATADIENVGGGKLQMGDLFKLAGNIATFCFPFVTMAGGFLLTMVLDHDRDITSLKSTSYTVAKAGDDRDKVSNELKALSESLHRLELHVAEQNQTMLNEIRELLRNK